MKRKSVIISLVFASVITLVLLFVLLNKQSFFVTNEVIKTASQEVQYISASVAKKIPVSKSKLPTHKKEPLLTAKKSEPTPIEKTKTATKIVSSTTSSFAQKTESNTLTASVVFVWTNKNREENGNLAPLKRNPLLDAAAMAKVQDILDRQYFEHVSPTGENVVDLAVAVGYKYLRIGENLALGDFLNEKDLLNAWMASPGHRANILDSRYEEIGVAVLRGVYKGRRVWVAVQEFGKPTSSCTPPDVLLKNTIEENRIKIESLSAHLVTLRSELEALKNNSDASVYNQKVVVYNNLVNETNSLVEKIKPLTGNYNDQIALYNRCIGI
jgi:uncharacterized protein YkwD